MDKIVAWKFEAQIGRKEIITKPLNCNKKLVTESSEQQKLHTGLNRKDPQVPGWPKVVNKLPTSRSFQLNRPSVAQHYNCDCRGVTKVAVQVVQVVTKVAVHVVQGVQVVQAANVVTKVAVQVVQVVKVVQVAVQVLKVVQVVQVV